jgi:hypothetical protein
MFSKKANDDYIKNEILLHEVFKNLKIEKYFLKPIKIENNTLYFKKLRHDFHSYYKLVKVKDRAKFWNKIFIELSYVISILEKNHIQHNDLHLGNIMFDGDQIKIIDLETMTNYKSIKFLFSNLPKAEKHRMGFSDNFHIGADLNQALGYIFEEYKQDIPDNLLQIENRIIKLNKEFPYAIDIKNNKTSGYKIASMFCKTRR